MLIPSSLGLVLTALPPDRLKRGVRMWAVSGAAAGSIGPVVRGLLTSLSWRWIFVVNLPIGLAAILVTWKLIPNARYDRTTRIPDPLGSLMIIVAIGAVSLGLLNGSSWGWGSTKVIASWLGAVAAFVISTRRATVPVVDPKMFRNRVFTSVIFGIALLAISLFLEQSWHYSTITTGLAIAPGPAMVLVGSQVAQKMHKRFPVGAVAALGFAFLAAGQILMLLTLQHHIHSYPGAVLPGWLLVSIGFGFTFPTIIGSATHDLPPEASAAVNSGRQIGGVFGTSILAVILGKAEVTGAPDHFYELWWVAAALCAPAATAAYGLTPRRSQPATLESASPGPVRVADDLPAS